MNIAGRPTARPIDALLREVFEHSLTSVDARVAVETAIRSDRAFFDGIAGVYSIALGKAAFAMAAGLEEAVGNKLNAGVASGYELPDVRLSNSWSVFHGGHPVPNGESMAVARTAIDLLTRVDKVNTLVVFLISGGGSSMFELPISDDISLNDLRETNRVLIECGAQIGEVNAIRRRLSLVKGGKLAAFAPRSKKLTMIVSDTNSGEAYNVASGPTIGPLKESENLHETVEKYELANRLPVAILHRLISEPTSGKTSDQESGEYRVLLDNSNAVSAVKRNLEREGFVVEIADSIVEDEIATGCELLAERLTAHRQRVRIDQPVAVVSGGEFRCPVRGNGTGGRNLESALRTAIIFDELKIADTEFAALFAGTDGVDGNSPAAGAICDSQTLKRASAFGLDAGDHLDRSDSYSYFCTLGDTIETGPTGTNVRDIRILTARYKNLWHKKESE